MNAGQGQRRTRHFWPQQSLGQGSIHRLVLTRDAHLGLVPIGGRSSTPGFAVEIRGEGDLQAVSKVLARDRHDYGLAEAVCGFIEEVAGLLVAYGEVAYEIVPRAADPRAERSDGTETALASAAAVDLMIIPPLSLRSIGPLIFQLIPGAKRWSRPEVVKVPADAVWRIELPKALGGARRERRMLRYVDRIERRARRFANPAGGPTGYDFTAAHRADNAEFIRATRRWGVVGTAWLEGVTDYFQVAGLIANQRAQAILRDHIVEETNRLLRRLDLPEIQILGLPSVSDIDRALADLQAGQIDLVKARELTTFR
jgi:hypothetical protein